MWEPAEGVAKNAEGARVALMGGAWVPVEQAAKNADGKFMVLRGGAPSSPPNMLDGQKPVPFTPGDPANAAKDMSESERRLMGATRALTKPIEAVQQIGRAVDLAPTDPKRQALEAEIQANARVMKGVQAESAKDTKGREISPLVSPGGALLSRLNAGGVETLGDVTTGAMVPGPAAATALKRILTGAGMGGLFGAGTEPVVNGGDLLTEKAKQAGVGAAAGGGMTGAIEALSKLPGVGAFVRSLLPGGAKPAAAPQQTAKPEVVTDELQGIRTAIEGKVQGKQARAEQGAAKAMSDAEQGAALNTGGAEMRLAAARNAPSAAPTASAGEFGATARAAMVARQAELEAARDTGTKELLDSALNSGAKIEVAGIPKNIDLMLKNEKNPDIVKALLKAKASLMSKEGGDSADALITQLAQARPGTPEYRELAQRIQQIGTETGPRLDATVRGLDSARLYINSMLSGRSADPADKFAQAQLIQIRNQLESALEKGSPEYGKYLANYRELSRPLDAFSNASGDGRRAAATVQKDRFEGDFMSSPESMGQRFFRAGDEGVAAAREFKTATNGNPEAMESLSAYVSGKLKDLPPDKWGPFLQRHESALREYGMLDALRSQEQRALTEAAGLASAESGGKEAIAAAKAQGKQGLEGAKKTASNVQSVLDNSVLGGITSAQPGFVRMGSADARKALEGSFGADRAERNLDQLVKLTRTNPEAATELKATLKEWVFPMDTRGTVKVEDAAKRWQQAREAIKSSNAFEPKHFEAIDKVMQDFAYRQEAGASGKAMASVAGWFVGMGTHGTPGAGAMIGRTLARAGKNPTPQQVNEMIEKAMADPATAQALAAPATQANIERAMSIFAGREAAEQNPRPVPKKPSVMGMRPAGL